MDDSRDQGDFDDFDALVERFFDATITDEEAARLLRAVEEGGSRADAFFREYENDFLPRFHARMKKHSLDGDAQKDPTPSPRFTTAFWGTNAEKTSPESSAHSALPQKKTIQPPRPAPRLGALSVIVIILALLSPLVYLELFPSTSPDANDVYPEPSNAVATITTALDVQCGRDQVIVHGKPLGRELIQFDSGTVELLFFSGVRAVVEGPAELVLKDDKQVYCRKGTWSVAVPPQGSGFEIQTNQGTIRDIGTEFHATINEESTRVDVVRGEVEWKPPAQGKRAQEKLALKTHQAIQARSGQATEHVAADVGRYRDRMEISRRFERLFRQRLEKAPVKQEAAPYFTVDFSPDSRNGAFHGGQWIDGPEPGRQAFRFVEPDARIRLKTSERLDSFTAILWLKIDSLNAQMNPLLMSEGNARGGIVWHVRKQGSIVFGLRHHSNRQAEMFESPVVLTNDYLKRRIQLAVVVNAPQRTVSLFLDGRPIHVGKTARSPGLQPGALDLGNWMQSPQSGRYLQALAGEIDDFRLHDRALSGDEITMDYFEQRCD